MCEEYPDHVSYHQADDRHYEQIPADFGSQGIKRALKCVAVIDI